MCFVDLEYVLLKENELCDQQNIIDNENECLEAAMSIDSDKFDHILSDEISWLPRGCFVDAGWFLWLINHPVGNRQEKAAPICRKGKFICP